MSQVVWKLCQLRAQLLEVVRFAVVGDDIPPVRAVHGLVAVAAQVHDGQPAVRDAAALVGVVALVVRAAVADGVAHGL